MLEVKRDEIWEVHIKFWPEDTERHMLIRIYYVWRDGSIQFVPALCYDGGPIYAASCAKFELLRKVNDNEIRQKLLEGLFQSPSE